MAQLRTPDGRSLEASASILRITTGAGFFQDPPGGLTAHPEMLAPFLQAVGTLLDERMHQAEHDETLAVQEQEHVIQSVLLGQAVCVGLEAYAARQDLELLELVGDLAATLDVLNPLGHGILARLSTINAAAGLDGLEGVPLLPGEFAHAVTVVMDHAARAELAISTSVQSRLDWAGYRPPGLLKNPLHPIRAALTPPATLEPARMPREQELRRLARSPLEGERNAALLLLHVNGRDRLENAPLVRVLDLAQLLLLSLRAAGGSPALNTLMTLHGELHRELGAPHLPGTQQFKRQGLGDPGTHTWAARRLLRRLRYDRQREPTPAEKRHLEVLWEALRALDRDLAAGITPEQDDALRARLVLLSLQGLTSTARAPGMSLPPMVQLAAQISGIDPLWEWERTQPGGQLGGELHGDLGQLIHCGLLLDLQGTAYWKTWGAQVRRVTVLAAGHLFARVRRAGIRLPEQSFLEGYFARLGPLRALPLSPRERENLEATFGEALFAARETVEDLQRQEAEGEVRQAEPEGTGLELPVEDQLVPADGATAEPGAPGLPAPAHIAAARQQLSGRRVVLLGGVPSPAHRVALIRALDLREFDWIGSDEYAHGTHAHARVTPDTALVVLAIRWMGHAHSALREVARARGVPFVMHPGGLSPSSVAWQVMQQVSSQLDGRATASGPAEIPVTSAL